MLFPGQLIPLAIEKPAAGGPMIARHDGQIVLVGGAIPGERVVARVDRVAKGVAHAQTVKVEEPSSDRREPFTDPLCGGCLYAHVDYTRQLELKSQIIADAMLRIGRVELPTAVAVQPSKTDGYRMRARLHLRGGRAGFFREGTHELCDARSTRQLLSEACDVLDRLAAGLRSLGVDAISELELSENADGTERAVHLAASSPIDPRLLRSLVPVPGLTGLSMTITPSISGIDTLDVISGDPRVADTLSIDGVAIGLHRHVLAFFQGNRYLLHDLVHHVIDQVPRGSEVVDLYAGVGLFAVSAAVARDARVIAVEGDRVAARDLSSNASVSGASVDAVCQSVEAFVAATTAKPAILIVDPPRTGLSKEAIEGAVRLRPAEIVYVSCDVATLARDTKRLIDAGYRIERINAFDLFPNTPHVETVVSFRR